MQICIAEAPSSGTPREGLVSWINGVFRNFILTRASFKGEHTPAVSLLGVTRSWVLRLVHWDCGKWAELAFLKSSPEGLGSYCTHCRKAGFRGKNCGKGRIEGPSGVLLVHEMACPHSYTEGYGGITHSCNIRPAIRKRRLWKPVPTVLNIINFVQNVKERKKAVKITGKLAMPCQMQSQIHTPYQKPTISFIT